MWGEVEENGVDVQDGYFRLIEDVSVEQQKREKGERTTVLLKKENILRACVVLIVGS